MYSLAVDIILYSNILVRLYACDIIRLNNSVQNE